MRHGIGLALMAALLVPPCADAATASRAVGPGDEIRYRSPRHRGWIRAGVVEVRADEWLLSTAECGQCWTAVGPDARVEVLRKRGTHAGLGFGIGFVPGALFGAALASFGCLDYEGPGPCPTTRTTAAAVLVCGGVSGALGAAVGSLFKSERWEAVAAARPRVSVIVTPGPRGRGLGAALSVGLPGR